jgi:hypothetical protein
VRGMRQPGRNGWQRFAFVELARSVTSPLED